MRSFALFCAILALATPTATLAVNDCTSTVSGSSGGYAMSCSGSCSAPGNTCQSVSSTFVDWQGKTRTCNKCACASGTPPTGTPGPCCQALQVTDANGNVTGRAVSGSCSAQDASCPYGNRCSFGTYGTPQQDQGKCGGAPPHEEDGE